MKGRFIYILCAVLCCGLVSRAQKKDDVQVYIETYKEMAMREMLRSGVPASITLAQGIHESSAGMSDLVQQSNNHFGIKCKSNWTGESVRHDDDARSECFRKYPSPEDSYRDHSDFLKNSARYATLFSLDPADYKAWAKGLKQAGYATNPKYPEVLIKLIEDYNLQEYTMMALGKKSGDDENPVKDATPQPVTVAENPENINVNASTTFQPSSYVQQYPEGIFKINETKVVFVKKDVSYLSVAQQYGVDLSGLFKFNDMDPAEQTVNDQLVYLQPKRKTGNNEFHLVVLGETLHDIAQAEAIRLESLRELNWLKNDQVPAAGEMLSLTKKSASIPRLALRDNYNMIPGTKPQTSH